tara:strand:+ start:2261 stop:2491 length:231 start_codon:yes stop_codon:yes gene_type:complete
MVVVIWLCYYFFSCWILKAYGNPFTSNLRYVFGIFPPSTVAGKHRNPPQLLLPTDPPNCQAQAGANNKQSFYDSEV